MCGAKDCRHCQLHCKSPQFFIANDYWCRRDIYSVLLQGICDVEMIIWDACVKALGGTHDATHLRQSSS
jgi:hypothetical protein